MCRDQKIQHNNIFTLKTKLRKITLKRIVFILIFFPALFINAQNDSLKTSKVKSFFSYIDLGADLKSRYIWRGINLGGHTASIQPYISCNFAKGWNAGIWGAYSFGEQPNQEVDTYISYTAPGKKINLIITDYFFPDYSLRNNHYLDFSDDSGHVFELTVTLSPFNDLPLSLAIATNFYGADKKVDSEGNPTGRQSYSTYIQADYSSTLATVDLNFFLGGVIANVGKYYGDEINAFINMGVTASKAISITERLSLPIDTSLIFNPSQENIFLIFGLSI